METTDPLIGVGLYTPAEAGRLLGIPPAKIRRWLRGHDIGEAHYQALWKAQVDLGEEGVFLGFRDLMEVRVASEFIRIGLTPQRVRRAIEIAREIAGDERPLSTTRFKTDGRSVFLRIVQEGETKLIDLFSSQYAFETIIARSLKHIDFDDGGTPIRWWPLGRSGSVVLDPDRSFGQPIEAETSVPTVVLASACEAEGSAKAAARVWSVPTRAVKRSVAFQRQLSSRKAA